MANKRKSKSEQDYNKLRRSINEKIKRAEKSGTIEKGRFEKMPVLKKGITGQEARKSLTEARRYSDKITKAINKGRAEKRIESRRRREREKRRKDPRFYEMIVARFEQEINNIPLPYRPLSKNETPGKLWVLMWWENTKRSHSIEELAKGITAALNAGYMITAELRYKDGEQTGMNATKFVNAMEKYFSFSLTDENLYEFFEGVEDAEDDESISAIIENAFSDQENDGEDYII